MSTIPELLMATHSADLLREAEEYRRRSAARRDRTQPERAPRRSLLAFLRHQPAGAVGCQA